MAELQSGGAPCKLNNLGDVAGRAGDTPMGEIQATKWNRGALRRQHLGKLQGGDYSSANGINDSGEVAGAGNVTGSVVPFLWIHGAGGGFGGFRCCPGTTVDRHRLLTGTGT